MSYNIDSVDIVASDGFRIARAEWEALAEENEADLPEISFLDDQWATDCCVPDGEFLVPKRMWWSGEGSGHSEELFMSLLASFKGNADLVLTWEGGDSFSGLRLVDSVVTEHKVTMSLGEQV